MIKNLKTAINGFLVPELQAVVDLVINIENKNQGFIHLATVEKKQKVMELRSSKEISDLEATALIRFFELESE